MFLIAVGLVRCCIVLRRVEGCIAARGGGDEVCGCDACGEMLEDLGTYL